ncbi:MAG: hypothetical protein Q4P18_07790 [Methanobrevibacter sp.]|uniref:hypothetical protein n=1 Tax=Methanobrevibacter sp. TaxID=66852 RepID=UPI0026DF10FA|nr:hypothetical protein [Methanobrevibacter sp.]MDO5849421.1 hypothetical protein [Methanobrevibacter sp.]
MAWDFIYKNKRCLGIFFIFIDIILFLSNHLNSYDLILIIAPILLCVLKENKALGIIFIILSSIYVIMNIYGIISADQMIIVNDYGANNFYNEMVFELQISYLIKAIYGTICLISSYMLFWVKR